MLGAALTFKQKVTKLQNKSKSILDVFTATKNDLEKNNSEIIEVREEIYLKIEDLKSQQDVLGSTEDANNRVINKINEFVNG